MHAYSVLGISEFFSIHYFTKLVPFFSRSMATFSPSPGILGTAPSNDPSADVPDRNPRRPERSAAPITPRPRGVPWASDGDAA